MENIAISYKNYLFIQIHKYQILCNNYIFDRSEKGFYSQTLMSDALIKILELLKNNKYEQIKYIIIDFINIKKFQKNLFELLNNISDFVFKKGKTLIFTNIDSSIIERGFDSIIKRLGRSTLHKDYLSSKHWVLFNKTPNVENFYNKVCNMEKKSKEKYFSSNLYYSLEKFNRFHTSTPVVLNKYINIKKLIEKRNCIFHFLYELCNVLHVKNVISYNNREEIALFFYTLNGAYIASMLSDLLLVDLVFIDHVDPINQIYHKIFDNIISPNKKYIIISDVICLGTELAVAKNIIQFAGGIYKGSISLVKVMTDEIDIVNHWALFKISKSNNPINYRISVPL